MGLNQPQHAASDTNSTQLLEYHNQARKVEDAAPARILRTFLLFSHDAIHLPHVVLRVQPILDHCHPDTASGKNQRRPDTNLDCF